MECSCIECYWNLAHPKSKSTPQCVSEDYLDEDFDPTPNDMDKCKHSWSYTEACGHKKFKELN